MKILAELIDESLSAKGLSRETALRLLQVEAPELIFQIMEQANRVRHMTRGDEIELCAIINAKSGKCSEDCKFCAQSAHNQADAATYPLLDKAAVLEAAGNAKQAGISRFSVVTSGKGVRPGKELETIAEMLQGIASMGLSPCASLGILDEDSAKFLKDAGLKSYHHNLETAPAFYPAICSTHAFEDRINTARKAREQGFRLCCGGIIGLGETREMRVDFAFTLKELAPDSIPLNFLNPISGTPLAGSEPVPPLEILKTIAVFRLIMPDKDIRTCGGKEKNLRGLQPLIYLAGANATMTGNYLTTSGRNPGDDIRDIIDLGLRIK